MFAQHHEQGIATCGVALTGYSSCGPERYGQGIAHSVFAVQHCNEDLWPWACTITSFNLLSFYDCIIINTICALPEMKSYGILLIYLVAPTIDFAKGEMYHIF